MRGSGGSCLSNSCRKSVFLTALFALIWVTPALAQKASSSSDTNSPKYDSHTEASIKGTVEEVKLPPKGNEIAHLILKNGTDTVDVYLCPKSFLDDMGLTFSKGEEVAVTGSKVKFDGADVVLARELAKGNDSIVLRDNKGGPVWSWQKKN